ncbi:MAG: response regulator transcription factor [Bacteroidota bacterium]
MAKEINILVVEEQPIIADELIFSLEEMGYNQIDIVYSGSEALSQLEQKKYDLALLDINLKGQIDGITIARKLYELNHTPYIFLAAQSDRNALDTFKKLYPSACLCKPLDENDLRVNIEITLSNFHYRLQKNKHYAQSVYVKDRLKFSKLFVENILFFEGANNYTVIHTPEKNFVLSQHLKKVATSFDPKIFVRIHKSSIVNMCKIEEIQDAQVTIGNHRLPIGRTYRDNFMSKLNIF